MTRGANPGERTAGSLANPGERTAGSLIRTKNVRGTKMTMDGSGGSRTTMETPGGMLRATGIVGAKRKNVRQCTQSPRWQAGLTPLARHRY
jgi:hypothetical protein